MPEKLLTEVTSYLKKNPELATPENMKKLLAKVNNLIMKELPEYKELVFSEEEYQPFIALLDEAAKKEAELLAKLSKK